MLACVVALYALAAQASAGNPAGPENRGAAASSDAAVLTRYQVSGRSAAELRRELNAKGPLGKDGHRHDGSTDWSVDWRYRSLQRGANCVGTSLTVKPSGAISLPECFTGAVDKLLQALLRHEQGHDVHAVAAAEHSGTHFNARPHLIAALSTRSGWATPKRSWSAIDNAILATTRQARTGLPMASFSRDSRNPVTRQLQGARSQSCTVEVHGRTVFSASRCARAATGPRSPPARSHPHLPGA